MGLNLEQRIQNLALYYTQLPRIEADGSSECPGAEAIFFKAQLAARALEAEIEYERGQAEYERQEAEKKSGEQKEAGVGPKSRETIERFDGPCKARLEAVSASRPTLNRRS
jgi:hypothetical protein